MCLCAYISHHLGCARARVHRSSAWERTISPQFETLQLRYVQFSGRTTLRSQQHRFSLSHSPPPQLPIRASGRTTYVLRCHHRKSSARSAHHPPARPLPACSIDSVCTLKGKIVYERLRELAPRPEGARRRRDSQNLLLRNMDFRVH